MKVFSLWDRYRTPKVVLANLAERIEEYDEIIVIGFKKEKSQPWVVFSAINLFQLYSATVLLQMWAYEAMKMGGDPSHQGGKSS